MERLKETARKLPEAHASFVLVLTLALILAELKMSRCRMHWTTNAVSLYCGIMLDFMTGLYCTCFSSPHVLLRATVWLSILHIVSHLRKYDAAVVNNGCRITKKGILKVRAPLPVHV